MGAPEMAPRSGRRGGPVTPLVSPVIASFATQRAHTYLLTKLTAP